jgi:hypothetical protein
MKMKHNHTLDIMTTAQKKIDFNIWIITATLIVEQDILMSFELLR